MNIVIHPQYEYLTDFIHRLPAFFEKEGTTIYDGRNRIKVFQINGLLLNVKRFRKPILINRLIYSFLRAPKAKRSYEYALRLREKGIDTPEPIAYILCEEKGLLSWSYFISFQMPETYHTLYEAGQGPIEENSELFRALGTYTAHLHQKGIYHRDYSPGNILYHQEPDGIHFSLIDINRMSFGKVSLKQGREFRPNLGWQTGFPYLGGKLCEDIRRRHGPLPEMDFPLSPTLLETLRKETLYPIQYGLEYQGYFLLIYPS